MIGSDAARGYRRRDGGEGARGWSTGVVRPETDFTTTSWENEIFVSLYLYIHKVLGRACQAGDGRVTEREKGQKEEVNFDKTKTAQCTERRWVQRIVVQLVSPQWGEEKSCLVFVLTDRGYCGLQWSPHFPPGPHGWLRKALFHEEGGNDGNGLTKGGNSFSGAQTWRPHEAKRRRFRWEMDSAKWWDKHLFFGLGVVLSSSVLSFKSRCYTLSTRRVQRVQTGTRSQKSERGSRRIFCFQQMCTTRSCDFIGHNSYWIHRQKCLCSCCCLYSHPMRVCLSTWSLVPHYSWGMIAQYHCYTSSHCHCHCSPVNVYASVQLCVRVCTFMFGNFVSLIPPYH